MKIIHIPSFGVYNYSTFLKYPESLEISFKNEQHRDLFLGAYKEILKYNSETYYDITLRITSSQDTTNIKFPASALMHCYEHHIPIPFNLFYNNIYMELYLVYYLVVPENTVPPQPFEIHYNGNVYIPIGEYDKNYKYIDNYDDPYITLEHHDENMNKDILIELLQVAIDLKHPRISWLYDYFVNYRSVSSLKEIINYAMESGSLPDHNIQAWLYNACIVKYPKYAEQFTKVYNYYTTDPIYGANHIVYNHVNDLLDLFIIDVHSTFRLPYMVRFKTVIHTFDNMINYQYVYNKYPDIGNNPTRFAWWLNSVMPYAIISRFKNKKNWSILYTVAGLIGLWSSMVESGTGSNSWLIVHPIKFTRFAESLLTSDSTYYDIMWDMRVGNFTYVITGSVPVKKCLNVDYNIFYSLDKSIEWVKNIVRRYNPLQHIRTEYKLNYPVDIIPSPSGLCLLPFVVSGW